MIIKSGKLGLGRFLALSATCGLLAVGSIAQATTWLAAGGKIRSVTLSAGTNEAFRIFLSNNGVDPLVSCSNDFAYLNASDDNYQAKTAALLSAYAQGKTVGINYIVDTAGFCQITDLSF